MAAIIMCETGIDPREPWKLTREPFVWPTYEYRVTSAEWKALLALAKSGDAECECRVATYYDYGCRDESSAILVRRSAARAVAWYRRSAEHGFDIAQMAMGVFAGDGRRMKRDVPAAITWLRRAARQGASGAESTLAITYRENGHLRRAVTWFKRGVAAGDYDAMIQLGVHLYWGKGARIDAAGAVRWFRKAASAKTARITEAGRDDANFYLAVAHLEGRGVKRSEIMARKLLERANRDDDHPAARRLLREIEKKRAAEQR